MPFTAGQKLKASDLNSATGDGVIARNIRATGITPPGSTNTRMLSTIATVTSGRSYKVTAKMEAVSTVSGVTSQTELHYTTDGTEPTSSSTIMGRTIWDHRTSGVPDTVIVEGYYHALASGTFRVALTGYRVVGTGDIAFSGAATYPMTLTVEDVGLTVAVSGTVY